MILYVSFFSLSTEYWDRLEWGFGQAEVRESLVPFFNKLNIIKKTKNLRSEKKQKGLTKIRLKQTSGR